jgi:hypothetical protein
MCPLGILRSIRKIKYRFHEQTMTAFTNGFKDLNVLKASATFTTEIDDLVAVQGHVVCLQTDMRRVTTTVPHNWIQSGMEVAIDKALQGVTDQVASHEQSPIKNVELCTPQPTRFRSSARYSRSHADVYKGETLSMRSGQSPKLGAKYLIPKYFHGSYSSISSAVFGTICLNTKTFYIEDPKLEKFDSPVAADAVCELETQFAFYPACWLMWRGIKFGFNLVLSREGQSWKSTLQIFHAVPDSSSIFNFCEQGNLQAVNLLLTSGQASL